MKERLFTKKLLFITMILASCSAKTEPSQDQPVKESKLSQEVKVQSIGSKQTKELLLTNEDIVILDVRTLQEYNAGHLKYAQHVDFYSPDFSKNLHNLDRDKPYIVYCASGGRSGKAAEMMGKMGFNKVYNVSEGFDALQKRGIPTD